MENKVKHNKRSKNPDLETLEECSKEDLIERIKTLTAHNIQLKNLLSKHSTTEKQTTRSSKPFDFSKCTFQHVALHLMYLGWNYKGFVVQEDTTDTIEHHLFEALTKAKLIKDRSSSNYHRCGRTDKGVSSLGQVISLDLRSNGSSEEINYCKILNRLLPNDIQCVAWSPVTKNFSARFNCINRQYRYYFPKGNLNISKMFEASKKLIGTHDFRNFCKMDVGNGVVEFIRNIMEINISPIGENNSVYQMYVITIKAKAFLWHQIRCIMGVLFLIGQEREEPSVIDELLDISKYPRKPEYSLASEIPLNLYYCEFESDLEWKYETEVLNQLVQKLNTVWTLEAVKTNMLQAMVSSLQEYCNEKKESKCLSESLVQSCKSKNYIPLLRRQTCDSLEDKIKHYTKRKRIEKVNKDEENS